MNRNLPNPRIQALLDGAYLDFHSQARRDKDPISLAHGYSNSRDKEIVAFIASLLAYGNVQTILASVRRILAYLGPNPHQTLVQLNPIEDKFTFRHRFTNQDDLAIVFHWLSVVLVQWGSLETFFLASSLPLDSPTKALLSDFVRRLFAIPLPPSLVSKFQVRQRSLNHLISDPSRGSACKRLNMFLRWMVREEDGIDLGLWKGLKPNQLILPVDTHLLQTLRALRWTESKQATWKVAEAATQRLKLYSPSDPVRYDFALCHLSMSGNDIRKYRSSRAQAQME